MLTNIYALLKTHTHCMYSFNHHSIQYKMDSIYPLGMTHTVVKHFFVHKLHLALDLAV